MNQIATVIDQADEPRPVVPAATTLTPLAMIDRAVASGANVETLERLMALQERYEANEAKKEFDAAIAAAKAEIKPIVKNRSTSFESKGGGQKVGYAYEDLAAVADSVDPILTKHGLSYRYQSKQDHAISVTCIISHKRGHREETTLQAPSDTSGAKNNIQAIGSTVTYLQRYTLKLALGLAAAKDEDGAITSADEPKLIDETQYRYLVDLIDKAQADEAKMLAHCKVESLEDFDQKQFKWAEGILRKLIKEREAK